jgi:hypothetical protein
MSTSGDTIIPTTSLKTGIVNHEIGRYKYVFAIYMDDAEVIINTIKSIRENRSCAILNVRSTISMVSSYAKWALNEIKY